jgi:hypothetical protein
MAKVNSPLFSNEARGKVGGIVYNTWRGINYVRTCVTPDKQGTVPQLAIQAIFESCRLRWYTLTDAQRALWTDYANSHTRSDWASNTVRMSGFNAFRQCNFRLQHAGGAWLDDPPIDPNFVIIDTLQAVQDGADLDVSWTLLPAIEVDTHWTNLWLSFPMSAGRSPKIEDCHHVVYADATDLAASIAHAGAGRYGLFARTVHKTSGLISPWTLALADVTAQAAPPAPQFQSRYPADAHSQAPGDILWLNPGNVKALDSVYSQTQLDIGQTSERLHLRNFGFTIPLDATILGIIVNMLGYCDTADTESLAQLALTDPVGDAKFNYFASPDPSAFVFGGSTDLWGASLTPLDINSEDFGVIFHVSATLLDNNNCYIDAASIDVYYQPA